MNNFPIKDPLKKRHTSLECLWQLLLQFKGTYFCRLRAILTAPTVFVPKIMIHPRNKGRDLRSRDGRQRDKDERQGTETKDKEQRPETGDVG